MKLRPILFLAILAVAVACGEGRGSKSDKAATAALSSTGSRAASAAVPLFKPADLKPSAQVRPLTADAIRSYMDRGGPAAGLALGDAASVDDSQGDTPVLPNGGCVDQAIDRLAMRAHGDTAVISGTLDVSSCLAASFQGMNADVLAAKETVKVYIQITCAGVDLSSYDGKSYMHLAHAGEHPCHAAHSILAMTQTEDTQSARVRMMLNGQPVTVEQGRRILHADFGPDGAACRYVTGTSGLLERTACVQVSRELVTRSRREAAGRVVVGRDEGKEDYLRIEASATGERTDDGLPVSRLKVTRNGWTGEINYGGQIPGQWRMSKGGQTATGTVQP